ncbi:hypothetical protein AC1031_006628 [Aphanomyces cochlioides]|nr:hypothetical protein AC1031_006628 [Aphanomyces cochlioides]
MAKQSILNIIVQDTMHEVGRNLPIQFLLESNHREFAIRIAAETIWRILSANWTQTQSRAFQTWIIFTKYQRSLDFEAKRILLERQAGLARCICIAQDRINRFMKCRFFQWREESIRRTISLRENMILSIQYAWRRKLARHAAERIKLRHNTMKKHRAAVSIQRRVRGNIGRRRTNSLAQERKTKESAKVIQRAYRCFVVVQIYRREIKKKKAVEIQRVWRGRQGREVASNRRRLVFNAALSLYSANAMIALENARILICAVQTIQRCFRCYMTRSSIHDASRRLALRKQFFPSLRIQRSWRRFRSQILEAFLDQLVTSLVFISRRLAKRVIRRCASLAKANRTRAATVIQAHIRGVLSRMRVKISQIQVWHEMDLKLPRCDKEYLEWDTLTTAQGMKCLVLWKKKVKCWRDGNASQIQRIFRGYSVRNVYGVRQAACGDLRQLLNQPVHKFLLRRKAARVRRRWSRYRHATWTKTFLAWKGITIAMKSIKTMRHGERLRQIARWHFEKKQKRKILLHWIVCMHLQQEHAMLVKRVMLWRDIKLKTRFMKEWKLGTKNTVICCVTRDVILVIDVFLCWAKYATLIKSSKALRTKVHTRIKNDIMGQLIQYDILCHINDHIALQKFNRAIAKEHLQALHKYNQHRKKVEYRLNCLRLKHGKQIWINWVEREHFYRDLDSKYQKFRLAHLLKRWKTLKAIIFCRDQLRQRVDRFAQKQKSIRALVQWFDFMEKSKEYSILHAKAQRLFSKTFKRKAFSEWYQLWCSTAGLRRIQSATRIQARWRGKKGRRRFANIKALHKYRIAKRIEGGVDTPEISIVNIANLLRTKEWVILYAYLPWEAPPVAIRRAFASVATHWHLRKYISFVFCDATQIDPTTSYMLVVSACIHK